MCRFLPKVYISAAPALDSRFEQKDLPCHSDGVGGCSPWFGFKAGNQATPLAALETYGPANKHHTNRRCSNLPAWGSTGRWEQLFHNPTFRKETAHVWNLLPCTTSSPSVLPLGLSSHLTTVFHSLCWFCLTSYTSKFPSTAKAAAFKDLIKSRCKWMSPSASKESTAWVQVAGSFYFLKVWCHRAQDLLPWSSRCR